MKSLFKKIFNYRFNRQLRLLNRDVANINALEAQYSLLKDSDFVNYTKMFRNQLAEGKTLDDIKLDAFALVREASKRTLQMRHFDCQILGGLILNNGAIAEMKTGEGKTLMSTLPAYLNALSGKGVHIVTVNDYLARRDAEWSKKLYNFLGLSVDSITNNTNDKERKIAYNSDITYLTNNELGFDYLKDNMKYSLKDKVQRDHHYAIIDEVDSILIDESRTPLIISGSVNNNLSLYKSVNKIIVQLEKSCYDIDEKNRLITLNDVGIETVEKLLKKHNMIYSNDSLYDVYNLNILHHINLSLKAHHLFHKDVDYVVADHKIHSIDEFTGRVVEGRRYGDGLHQAIEAKENLVIQNENQTLASITFQNYFRKYKKLSGMTGTAVTESKEFKEIYGLDVVSVPTNLPVKRKDYDDEVYGTNKEKLDAIISQIKSCYEKGQPVLVGTVSIAKSEKLSSLLKKEGIPHNVLNAKYHDKEADIIAQAGRYKAVTIATNMAGRGTDIMLGGNLSNLIKLNDLNSKKKEIEENKRKVINAGGLYVIGTERHESRRVDNQLRGRSGRQGDPGETKFFLSLEDDLMRLFASDNISNLLRRLGMKHGESIKHPMITRALARAQSKVENNNFEIRRSLLKFDDVMNEQRNIIFSIRDIAISNKDLDNYINDIMYVVANKIIDNITLDQPKSLITAEKLNKEISYLLGPSMQVDIIREGLSKDSLIEIIVDKCRKSLIRKEKIYGYDLFIEVASYTLLNIIDSSWKDHLGNLDYLKQSVSLRAYGQKDPLSEYKREAFNMFHMMYEDIPIKYFNKLLNLSIASNVKNLGDILSNSSLYDNQEKTILNSNLSYNNDSDQIKSDSNSKFDKVGRNEQCPCGSGKKYKHCHG